MMHALASLGVSIGALVFAGAARAEEAGEPWEVYAQEDGVTYESRPVQGSAYPEYRATLDLNEDGPRVVDAIWALGTDSRPTPTRKIKVLRDRPDEVILYEQLSLPMVSDRDLTLRLWRVPPRPDGTLEVRWAAANDVAPPREEGYVRMEQLSGNWLLTPLPGGKLHLVYRSHNDPAGSLPTFLARGKQRERVELDVKNLVAKLKGN